MIIPFFGAIPYWTDTRILTSSFKAERTLTKDTVPLDVGAILFWKIVNPYKAAMDVADYQSAISWPSQTALHDVIGKTMLSDMFEGRDKISSVLQKTIDERTEPWGINVISVGVKDELIPPALEDSMSMQTRLRENARPASFSEIRNAKWRRNLAKRPRPTPTIRSHCICGP